MFFLPSTDYSVLQDSCCKPLLIMTASTLDEAKQQCAVDPSCAMFYDNCEKGNDFWKCDASATIYPSVCGSVLYKKGILEKYKKLTLRGLHS